MIIEDGDICLVNLTLLTKGRKKNIKHILKDEVFSQPYSGPRDTLSYTNLDEKRFLDKIKCKTFAKILNIEVLKKVGKIARFTGYIEVKKADTKRNKSGAYE